MANVLKTIEKRMEKMVEGLFGRAFKSSVQPVELAHKLAKEMGEHKTVSVSKVYVPNEFEVYLSPPDYEQLHSFEDALGDELARYLVAYARREGWTLVARPLIELHSDDDLSLGEFGIATRTATRRDDPEIAPEAAPGLSQTVVYQPPAAGGAPPAPVPPAAGAPGPTRTVGVLVAGATTYDLSAEATVIGRSKRCQVVLADPNVSRRHAEIRREGPDYVVIDLESTNGIAVNDRQVRRQALAEGDRLRLGGTTLRFERRPC